MKGWRGGGVLRHCTSERHPIVWYFHRSYPCVPCSTVYCACMLIQSFACTFVKKWRWPVSRYWRVVKFELRQVKQNTCRFTTGRTSHSPASSAEVKNAWSCNSTLSYVFMARCLVKHRDNFNLLYWLLNQNKMFRKATKLLEQVAQNKRMATLWRDSLDGGSAHCKAYIYTGFTEHVRNFVRSSVSNCIDFSITLYG